MDNPFMSAISATFSLLVTVIHAIPGSAIAIDYIKNSYQNDPFRVVLELALAIYAVKYMLSKKYRIDTNDIQLTENEIDELIAEWQPEPLVQPLSDIQRMELDRTQVIIGAQGPKPKVLSTGKNLMNLASTNYLGYITNEDIKDIAKFLGTEAAIIYAQGFSTIASVISAFSKRGDIIVADDGCNFAVLKGTQISRSTVKWFKHNDMADLERVLESINKESRAHKKRPLTRRFIVTEGLFQNYGDMAPLDKIMEFKHRYKYRVILDESSSFGLLGKTGRGLTELYNIPPRDVDMIVEVVDHQRLSGQAFVFSASIPAMLAVCASEAIRILETSQGEKLLKTLQDNAAAFHAAVASVPQAIELSSMPGSPILHLRIPSHVVAATGISTRDGETLLLQEIVDEVAVKDALLITRAKYVETQELHLPRPSIRISVSASHTKKDTEKAAQAIKSAFVNALNKRK
ncbi:serine palmitoyltransferase component [Mortierella antarctica]|nr:serine palmitoyltransferase component [Mortierella antarctica]